VGWPYVYDLDALVEILAAHDEPYLSPREVEVLRLVAGGLSYEEIAFQLGISRKTLSGSICEMKMRFAVRTRSELVRRCHELRLLEAPAAEGEHSLAPQQRFVDLNGCSVRRGLCRFRRS